MCGRFSLVATPEDVAVFFELEVLDPFPPRYNIAPSQPIQMIINGSTGNEGLLVRWGLLPHWVKDPGSFSLLVNARSETATEKPSFRTAMRHRRTLIPASGFYEWHRPDSGSKQAYWVRPRDGGICAFAGLMETWSNAEGSEIDTGCILTTASNDAFMPIHHRMPVVISPDDFEEWLDCRTREPRDVAHLMQAVEEDYFEAIPVSDRVNKVANCDPEIQAPVELANETETQKEKPVKNSPALNSKDSDSNSNQDKKDPDDQLSLF